MKSLTSIKSHLKKSSNVPSIPSIPLVITASGLTMTNGSANFVNSANWTYYVVTAGTGTISFNRAPLANIQVFASGGGGGGGGNNYLATAASASYTAGAGAGGGSGACYRNSVMLNSGTINISIGAGGSGGAGSVVKLTSGSVGADGGTTTISGNVFPSMSLGGGKGGKGGNTTVAVLGGIGGVVSVGTQPYITNIGVDGGKSAYSGIGTKGIGFSGIGISIGDTVVRNYCNSGSGGNNVPQNPQNGTYVNGLIGDGAAGANANTTTVITGGNGTNGVFILAVPYFA